jgi:peptide/nickel transport system substrate-binding protein
MRNLRWQLLIAIGGFILVLGLLIGQTTDPTTFSPQPVSGGVHVEALIGLPSRLNPILDMFNQVDRDVDRLIYSGLVEFDARGLPQPELAERWAVSADATLYTFTLRDDAYWHDGEPVISDDVVFTFSKLKDPEYPGPSDLHEFWSDINIIRLDDKSVQFQLPEPFAPFLDYLSIGLLPDHLLRGVSAEDLVDHPFNLEPIGSGPFRFEKFLLDGEEIQGVSLTAFDDFYGTQPFLDRVEFRYLEEGQAALEAYQQGEVQSIGRVDPAILPEVLASPTLNVHTARLPQLTLIFLNTQHNAKDYLGSKTFRQALMLAINRQWMINTVLQGQGLPAVGPIMPGTWAHSESLRSYPFDRERAGDLLDTLGWELPLGASRGTAEYIRSQEEETLNLRLTYTDDPQSEAVAQVVKTSWEAVGVAVDLEPVTARELLEERLQPRDFDVALTEIDLSRSPDPDPYPFWHDSQTETGQNYSAFDDRNISIWLEQARINPDFGRRAELYRNFQHRFQDQMPALLLFFRVYTYAIDSQVQGVTVGPLMDPSDRFANIEEWHLITRRSNEDSTLLETPPAPDG